MNSTTRMIIVVLFSLLVSGQGGSLDEPINKIVGGSGSWKGQFPWTVYLTYELSAGTTKACMGFLYKADWVITAGHCLPPNLVRFKVLAGMITTRETSTQDNTRYSSNYFTHPQYNSNTNENDIGLVQLETPFSLNAFIKTIPISLVPPAAGEVFVTAGFGLTRGGDMSSLSLDSLQWVELPYVDTEECNRILTSGRLYPEQMICAGGLRGKEADTCNGDSGSALVRTKNPLNATDAEVVGITSFGSADCGRSGSPGVYTRIAHYYHSFILPRTVGPESPAVPPPHPPLPTSSPARPPPPTIPSKKSPLPPPPPPTSSPAPPPPPSSHPPKTLSLKKPNPPPAPSSPKLPKPPKLPSPSPVPTPAVIPAKGCLLRRNKYKPCEKDSRRKGICYKRRCIPIYY